MSPMKMTLRKAINDQQRLLFIEILGVLSVQ